MTHQLLDRVLAINRLNSWMIIISPLFLLWLAILRGNRGRSKSRKLPPHVEPPPFFEMRDQPAILKNLEHEKGQRVHGGCEIPGSVYHHPLVKVQMNLVPVLDSVGIGFREK